MFETSSFVVTALVTLVAILFGCFKALTFVAGRHPNYRRVVAVANAANTTVTFVTAPFVYIKDKLAAAGTAAVNSEIVRVTKETVTNVAVHVKNNWKVIAKTKLKTLLSLQRKVVREPHLGTGAFSKVSPTNITKTERKTTIDRGVLCDPTNRAVYVNAVQYNRWRDAAWSAYCGLAGFAHNLDIERVVFGRLPVFVGAGAPGAVAAAAAPVAAVAPANAAPALAVPAPVIVALNVAGNAVAQMPALVVNPVDEAAWKDAVLQINADFRELFDQFRDVFVLDYRPLSVAHFAHAYPRLTIHYCTEDDVMVVVGSDEEGFSSYITESAVAHYARELGISVEHVDMLSFLSFLTSALTSDQLALNPDITVEQAVLALVLAIVSNKFLSPEQSAKIATVARVLSPVRKGTEPVIHLINTFVSCLPPDSVKNFRIGFAHGALQVNTSVNAIEFSNEFTGPSGVYILDVRGTKHVNFNLPVDLIAGIGLILGSVFPRPAPVFVLPDWARPWEILHPSDPNRAMIEEVFEWEGKKKGIRNETEEEKRARRREAAALAQEARTEIFDKIRSLEPNQQRAEAIFDEVSSFTNAKKDSVLWVLSIDEVRDALALPQTSDGRKEWTRLFNIKKKVKALLSDEKMMKLFKQGIPLHSTNDSSSMGEFQRAANAAVADYADQGERGGNLIAPAGAIGIPGLNGQSGARAFSTVISNSSPIASWTTRLSMGKSHHGKKGKVFNAARTFRDARKQFFYDQDRNEFSSPEDFYEQVKDDFDFDHECADLARALAVDYGYNAFVCNLLYTLAIPPTESAIEHEGYVNASVTDVNKSPASYVCEFTATGSTTSIVNRCSPVTFHFEGCKQSRLMCSFDVITKNRPPEEAIRDTNGTMAVNINGVRYEIVINVDTVLYDAIHENGQTIGVLYFNVPSIALEKFQLESFRPEHFTHMRASSCLFVGAKKIVATAFPTNSPRVVTHNVNTEAGDCGSVLFLNGKVAAVHIGFSSYGQYRFNKAYVMSSPRSAKVSFTHQGWTIPAALSDIDLAGLALSRQRGPICGYNNSSSFTFPAPFATTKMPQPKPKPIFLVDGISTTNLVNAPGFEQAAITEESSAGRTKYIPELITRVREHAINKMKAIHEHLKTDFKIVPLPRCYYNVTDPHFRRLLFYCLFKISIDSSANFLFTTYPEVKLTDVSLKRTKKSFMDALLLMPALERDAVVEKITTDILTVFSYGCSYDGRSITGAPNMLFVKAEAMKKDKILSGRTRTIKDPHFAISVLQYAFSAFIKQEDVNPFTAFLKSADFYDKIRECPDSLIDIDHIMHLAGPDGSHKHHSAVGCDLFQLMKKCSKKVNGKYVSLDVSGWDKSLPLELMVAIFEVFMVYASDRLCQFLCYCCCYNGNLVYNGHVYRMTSPSWCSGNRFTLAGNSFIHEAILDCFAPNCAYLIQGDDAVVTLPKGKTAEQLFSHYESAGLLLKEAHCADCAFDFCKIYVTKDKIEFDLFSSFCKGALKHGVDMRAMFELVNQVKNIRTPSREAVEALPESIRDLYRVIEEFANGDLVGTIATAKERRGQGIMFNTGVDLELFVYAQEPSVDSKKMKNEDDA